MSYSTNKKPVVQIGPLADRPVNPGVDGLIYVHPAGISAYDSLAGWIDTSSLSGVGSSPNFVLADFGTQDPSQGRYTSWTDLMAALQQVQYGAAPMVRCAFETGPFTVPLAGMPASGWDLRGGRLTSFYAASGTVVLNLPAGVKLDNCFGIGSGADPTAGSIFLKIDPPFGTGVLEWTALPSGAPVIFSIGGGCAVDHSTNTGALILTNGINGFAVLAAVGANQNVGLVPALTGPLVQLQGNDGAVGVQQLAPGGLPDKWIVGGGPTSGLLSIYDIAANLNTTNPAVWIPGFTGGGGVTTPFPLQSSKLLDYPFVAPLNWAGLAPTNVADALDRLAAAVAGLLGGPIP